MNELEEKLGALLSDPQLMGQLLNVARNLGAAPPTPPQASPPPAQDPGPDPAAIQALAGLARRSGVDQNQQALLKALVPYLSQNRLRKLERAMRAAKMAALASGFLQAGGAQNLFGR